MKNIFNRADFRNRIYGCFLGKNIGGTLGGPHEGKKYVLDLDFYQPIPSEPMANDDLDLQLVLLSVIEDYGIDFTLNDIASHWMKYCSAYPWNEYGFFVRNIDRGLTPPLSGWFENYYVDEMGSPIRSEIWACMAPGNPVKAAELAWQDSCIDHAGGEGMWGEMFWAAVQSAAFVIHDTDKLIRIGLAAIPPACNVSRVIREVCYLHKNGIIWGEARERIYRVFYNEQPCNAIVNIGFTLLGWLYGKDFGDKLCKAVNCGYDTDCTAATLGATLGIIYGAQALPEKWLAPIGDAIVLHRFTTNFAEKAPKNITELTDRIIAASEKFSQHPDALHGFSSSEGVIEFCDYEMDKLTSYWGRDLRFSQQQTGPYLIKFYYYGDPVFFPEEIRKVKVEIFLGQTQITPDKISFTLPDGWSEVQNMHLKAPDFNTTQYLEVNFEINSQIFKCRFAALSPHQVKGYPAGRMIERCKVCTGTPGHCLCLL